MNFGGSNHLNCIKIDPLTGEKFSFNVDIVMDKSSNGGVFVIVLYITSLSTNEIGCYLNYIQKRKSAAARGALSLDGCVGRRRLSGSLYGFLSDVIHSRSIA